MNKINFELEPKLQQHAVLKDILHRWIAYEERLVPITTISDVDNALWYGIITANIFNENELERAFSAPNESKLTYTRLSQAYITCCSAVGRTVIDELHLGLSVSLKEFGITNYKQLKKQYPFIAIIPILNDLYVEHYANTIFQRLSEQKIAP